MGFKFNRGCWVESTDYELLRRMKGKTEQAVGDLDVIFPEVRTGEGCCPEKARQLPTEQRLYLSRLLFAAWGEVLLGDSRVGKLLRQLRENISLSRNAMINLGITRACARCDQESPNGSCCSSGLEKKYDAVLLLINLLMGARLESEPPRVDSCRFLGALGCILPARHMLCVDYLCPDLEREFRHEALVRMQMATGPEIESCFRLVEVIKGIILKENKRSRR